MKRLLLYCVLTLTGCSSLAQTDWPPNTPSIPQPVQLQATLAHGQSEPEFPLLFSADHCNTPDDHSLAAVVRIKTADGGNGSGIVVATGQVITAAHVVEDGSATQVGFRHGFLSAQILALNYDSDLALLKVDTGNLRPIALSLGQPALAEPVWAIGFPLAKDQHTSSGTFKRVRNGRLFSSAAIDQGTSGGGLLRCESGNYELAGMVRGYAAYWSGDQLINAQISTAVPAREIADFLRISNANLL